MPGARPPYPENKMMPLRDVLLLDPRCKNGLVYDPPGGHPHCFTCGNGEPGIPYVRVGWLLDTIMARWGPAVHKMVLRTVSEQVDVAGLAARQIRGA